MTGLIVHEWLERHGGAERVVDEFARMLPDTPILTTWNDDPTRYSPGRVSETWIARTPLRGHKALTVPVAPLMWRWPAPSDVDWVVISSHLFAHHFGLRDPSSPKLVYVHTPARYIWSPGSDTRGSGLAARLASPPLRRIDKRRAAEASELAANSNYIRDRIERAWDLDSRVIYPPVNSRLIASVDWSSELRGDEQRVFEGLPHPYLFAASRLVPYKKVKEAIWAAHVADLPLVVAGGGDQLPELSSYAQELKVRVQFVGRVSDALMRSLFTHALAYVFPATEDFGIMPVEAMATGTPVIGSIDGGGVLETVLPGVSGALADFRDRRSINGALEVIATIPRTTVSEHAFTFDVSRFSRDVGTWLGDHGIDVPTHRADSWR